MKPNPVRSIVLPFVLLAALRATAQNAIAPVTAAPNAAVHQGQSVTMAVSAVPSALYQWRLNGVDLPGATGSSVTMIAGAADAGNYDVVTRQGTSTSMVALGAMSVAATDARLINLSARGMVGMTDSQMIMGFASQADANGTNPSVLLRGMGPSLGAMGGMMGSGVLANPMLTIYDAGSRMMGGDFGWMNAPTLATGSGASKVLATMQMASAGMMGSVGAFAPSGPNDSAIMMTAPAGAYTTVVGGQGTTGVALAECYDATPASSSAHLINMSARANVGTGNNVLIGGFVIGAGPSGDSATVLLRAMGPSLSGMGVLGAMANPTMTLYDASSKPVASATAWTMPPKGASGTNASAVRASVEPASLAVMSRVGAFPPTAGSTDSAMVATLPPGNYSVTVAGLPDSAGNATTGIALLEIYQVR